jgi:hypothetical protein
MAKVTYSFDAWKEGKVSASTAELPVNLPKDKDKKEGKKVKE